MGEGLVRKRGWPPRSKIALATGVLFIFLALFQALDALYATKTASVVLHSVLGFIQLAGSAFYFRLWRKGATDGRGRPG